MLRSLVGSEMCIRDRSPSLNDFDPDNPKFNKSFLFALEEKNILHLTGKNNVRALCYSENRGPILGKFNIISDNKTYYSYDLCVNMKVSSKKANYSCSQVGTTYGPVHKAIDDFKSSFLSGDNYFEVDELEVYQVKF